MYGRRGRIGLITLATDPTVQPEIARVAPEGVAVYQAPITLPRGEVTPEALAEMLANDELEQAAAKLAWMDVGVILFACTSGSFVHGPGWDRELTARIERAAGIPATTTSTAVVDALRSVGATSLTIATPYIDAVNEIERRFFEASGYRVAALAGLGLEADRDIARLEPGDAESLVARTDVPESDAIFVSCTNVHVLEAIDRIEAVHGKPVVTSNQAGAWAALRMIGVAEPIPGGGRLLTLPAGVAA
jgi:maleate isomerase